MKNNIPLFEYVLFSILVAISITIVIFIGKGIIENLDYIIRYQRGFMIFFSFIIPVGAFMWFCLRGTQHALDLD